MPAGLYEPGSSFLHRMDPAARIVTLASWFGVALILGRPLALAALFLFVLAVATAARLLGVLWRFARFMAILFVMSALLWAIFTRGGDAGGLPAGLWRGLWMGLRLTTMLTMGLIFLASTRVEEMAAGLQRLGIPFVAAFSLTLAFRLLPLFAESGATIVQAQACRGLDARQGGPLTRLRRHLPLLVPLVLSSVRSAGDLAVALESRGLGMLPRRTSAMVSRLGAGDIAAAGISLAAAGAAAALKLAGAVI